MEEEEHGKPIASGREEKAVEPRRRLRSDRALPLSSPTPPARTSRQPVKMKSSERLGEAEQQHEVCGQVLSSDAKILMTLMRAESARIWRRIFARKYHNEKTSQGRFS